MRTGLNDIMTEGWPVVLHLKVPLVLDTFNPISFLQFLLRFSRKRLLLRWIVVIVEGIRSSLEEQFVKAVAIFLFLAIKSTLITVPCNENVPRLLLQQLRCYLSLLDVWWHQSGQVSASTAGKINCLVVNARSFKKFITKTVQQTGNPYVTSIASRTWCTPKTLIWRYMRQWNMVEPKYQQLWNIAFWLYKI